MLRHGEAICSLLRALYVSPAWPRRTQRTPRPEVREAQFDDVPLGTGVVDVEQAKARVVGGPIDIGAADVVLGDRVADSARARLDLFVDARTGRVHHFQSDKHSCGFANCRGAVAAPEVDGRSVTLVEAPSVNENPDERDHRHRLTAGLFQLVCAQSRRWDRLLRRTRSAGCGRRPQRPRRARTPLG